ncbi:MAG: hypothetical protein JXA14_10800 [Anaerolineae bacterium]|nr:hypothetical protein [Anaerolineae bacterium]
MRYKQENSGEYRIPPWLLEFITRLAGPHPGGKILDLCWRKDDLLDAVDRQQPSVGELVGVVSCAGKVESRHRCVVSEPLVDAIGLERESFDAVLLNAPWERIRDRGLKRALSQRSEVEPRGHLDTVGVWLEWATWYLKPDARLIALVPGGFLTNYADKAARQFLLDRLCLDGVFEFAPGTALFPEVHPTFRTAVVCFRRGTPNDARPETFMAEIGDAQDWPQVHDLYDAARLAIEAEKPLHIAFAKVGRSSLFTGQPADTLSPARNYFAQQVLSKLAQFPAVGLGDIASVQVGMVLSGPSMKSEEVTEHKLLKGVDVQPNGQIRGCSYLQSTASSQGLPNAARVLTNDILIRAIQPLQRRLGTSPDPSVQGLAVAVVPPDYDGVLFDRTLLRVRLNEDAPPHISPSYLAQLLRNDFILPGFADLVLDQLASASLGSVTVTRQSILDLMVPVLPNEVLGVLEVRPTGPVGEPTLADLDIQSQLLVKVLAKQFEEAIVTDGQKTRAAVKADGEMTRTQVRELGERIIAQLRDHIAELQRAWEDRLDRAEPSIRDDLYEERAKAIHEFIEREMRDRSQAIAHFQERLALYTFGPYWALFSDDTRLFLASGEFWFDSSTGTDLTPPDYSGIAVEFCKAVEMELWRRLGQHFGSQLVSQGIEKYPFWSTSSGKYTKPNNVSRLTDPRATLGSFLGFLWGIAKRSDERAPSEYRRLAEEVHEAVTQLLPDPSLLLDESGIPSLLSKLIGCRNDSAHKDRLSRSEVEGLRGMVIPSGPGNSILVQIVQAIPLPGEEGSRNRANGTNPTEPVTL